MKQNWQLDILKNPPVVDFNPTENHEKPLLFLFTDILNRQPLAELCLYLFNPESIKETAGALFKLRVNKAFNTFVVHVVENFIGIGKFNSFLWIAKRLRPFDEIQIVSNFYSAKRYLDQKSKFLAVQSENDLNTSYQQFHYLKVTDNKFKLTKELQIPFKKKSFEMADALMPDPLLNFIKGKYILQKNQGYTLSQQLFIQWIEDYPILKHEDLENIFVKMEQSKKVEKTISLKEALDLIFPSLKNLFTHAGWSALKLAVELKRQKLLDYFYNKFSSEIRLELKSSEKNVQKNKERYTGSFPELMTRLHFACFCNQDVNLVSAILKEIKENNLKVKSLINALDRREMTPLYYAVMAGNKKVVELLINMGAKVNQSNKTSVLSLAAKYGHLEIAELLINNKAQVNSEDRAWEYTPLGYACANGHLKMAELLLANLADINMTDKSGKTPLHYACESGHLNIVRLLINNEACIDQVGGKGSKSPLNYALKQGHLEIVQLLIKEKANINQLMDGKTPLFLAAEYGHLDIVKELLQCGADANFRYFGGDTALSTLTKWRNNNPEARDWHAVIDPIIHELAKYDSVFFQPLDQETTAQNSQSNLTPFFSRKRTPSETSELEPQAKKIKSENELNSDLESLDFLFEGEWDRSALASMEAFLGENTSDDIPDLMAGDSEEIKSNTLK